MPRLAQLTLFDPASTEAFPISKNAEKAIHELSNNSNAASRGAVFTRSEAVAFILDLVGYTSNKPLYQK